MHRIALAAVLAVAPLAARSQPDSPPSTHQSSVHRHLGLFLRVDAGVGYLGSFATSPTSGELSTGGFAVPFGVAAGWAVIENFVVAADLWGAMAPSPRITAHGQSFSHNDAHEVLGGLGVNLTCYIMPDNLYVTVTPSAVLVGVTESGVLKSSTVGFGAKVAVGKEWWVGDHWGLGVAAQFVFGLTPEKNHDPDPPTWKTFGGGVAVSITYN
jgi:hypothetical protein